MLRVGRTPRTRSSIGCSTRGGSADIHRAHTSVWVTPSGTVSLDDQAVWRVQAGRAATRVGASGLSVSGPPGLAMALNGMALGTPGAVVEGTATSYQDPSTMWMVDRACWLETDGQVSCAAVDAVALPGTMPTITTAFAAKPVLALAGIFYNDSLCAVYVDGSIACRDANQQGQLGTGDTSYVATETEVQPPGSVDTMCQ